MANIIDSNRSSLIVAAEFANCAVNTGMLIQTCDFLIELATDNPADDSLPTQINELFTRILAQKDNNNEMFNLIENADGLSQLIFRAQEQMLNETTTKAMGFVERVCQRAYLAQAKKLDTQFKNSTETLDTYRNEPSAEKLQEVQVKSKKLSKRVNIIKTLAKPAEYSSPIVQRKLAIIDKANHRFEKVLADQTEGSLGMLHNQINSAAKEGYFTPEVKEKMQRHFDESLSTHLSEKIQKTIDSEVYKNSPGPKAGDDWGRLHRYDNLEVFSNAFLTAFNIETELEILEKIEEKYLPDFYQIMHAKAFGPKGVNPEKWVKNHFPSLKGLIDEAVECVQRQMFQDDLAIALGDSSKDEELALIRTRLFFDDSQELEIENEAPIEELATVSNLNSSYLISLEIKLRNHELQANGYPDTNRVENLILETLPLDLRNQLYEQVYFLADDRNSEIYNWGELHCADQMPRLYKAIENLKI